MQRLLVLVAMPLERDAILDLGGFQRQPPAAVLLPETYLATSSQREIRVACSGVGTVNAALTLALLAQLYAKDDQLAVVSLGVGGALQPGLATGDLVVASGVIQHDSIISSDSGLELMAPGALHLSLPPELRPDPLHLCDLALTAALIGAPVKASSDGRRRPGYHTGLILSGSEFIGSRERKIALAGRHPGALLVDMESAGLAQIARALGLPFAVLRTVADVLGSPEDADTANLYQDFKDAAAATAARAIAHLRR